MKRVAILLAVFLCCNIYIHAQGTSPANAITLSLDAVMRSYPVSGATGVNMLCTGSANTSVTWFKFTSNALGECPLLNLTASDSLACEVAFYTSPSSMLLSSSMCFFTGYGLWAPNENLILSPSTLYYLRIKTSSSCTIKIAGQSITPDNDNCFGALSIDGGILNDNNSCDHAGPGVLPSQLCALTLENTAWYQFYVVETGYSIITISNIHCDNGNLNNNNGFQIGFFKGSCSALEWINCSNGAGATVQATTAQLPAGTRVFVAVDGISGSNCSYSINGFNITGVLSSSLKKFSGWKNNKSNLLQWSTSDASPGYFIIERSTNGSRFSPIGRMNITDGLSGDKVYSFNDNTPPLVAYYRLKKTSITGSTSMSQVINISRETDNENPIYLTNPAGYTLSVKIKTATPGQTLYSIYNVAGQLLTSGTKRIVAGQNNLEIDLHAMPAGQYIFHLDNNGKRYNKKFVKSY